MLGLDQRVWGRPMLSTVKATPNYYELLGLSARATSDEIAQAFAREVSSFRPRPFGAAAEICVAYATLYDPAKRRAYDASIGLLEEPEPKPPALTSVELSYRREWIPAPFVAAPSAAVAAADTALPAPPVPTAPSQTRRRDAVATMSIKEQVEQVLALRGSDSDAAPELVEWARPGLTIGALLLAAAMIGAFAGLKSVETVEPPQAAARAATVGGSVGKPKAADALEAQNVDTSQTAPGSEVEEQPTRRPETRQREAPAEALTAVPVDDITESIQVTQRPVSDAPVEDGATEQVAAAALPIPSKTIARTIERIGYACGSVESAMPVEGGGAGVFKVSCTSGDVYRAAPIRGRYHFRRWGRR